MDNSKIAVDLRARTFEIDVPHDKIDAVLDRLESFFSIPVSTGSELDTTDFEESEDESTKATSNGAAQAAEVRGDGGRKRGKSSARLRSYEHVELGLNTEQREKFRSDFEAKGATQQSDIVAVAGYLLKKALGTSEFDVNQIHSAIKIVNKPTPKNLPAVFGNMKRDGIAGYAGGKVVINSLTEDFVEHHMASRKRKNGK